MLKCWRREVAREKTAKKRSQGKQMKENEETFTLQIRKNRWKP